MAPGCSSQSRVLPSMSVNRSVKVSGRAAKSVPAIPRQVGRVQGVGGRMLHRRAPGTEETADQFQRRNLSVYCCISHSLGQVT